jgi:EF hand
MKNALIAATVGALGLVTGVAHADDDKKHLRLHISAPVYGAHAPVHRPHVVVNHGHRYQRPHYGQYRGHSGYGHRGHWHNGRWVAPVVIGATVGALAIAAASPYYYDAPVYSAPVYHAPVNYYTPGDRFSLADVNNDGYLSFYEARRYGNMHRNFGAIDWNGDGYLSRDEVNAWRHSW